MQPLRYQEFLTFVFARPATEPGGQDWYWIEESNFKASDEEMIDLYTYLFTHCGRDLAQFSNDQIGMGLNYLFSQSFNFAYQVRDAKIEDAKKIPAIQSLKFLYKDCFEQRCTRQPQSKDANSRIDYICYMLWDITPLNFVNCKDTAILDLDAYIGALREVMESALYLANPACIESGLHGLGHLRNTCVTGAQNEAIEVAIATFLRKRTDIGVELQEYARAAAKGHIQ